VFWRKFALGILVTLFIGFLGVPVVADEPASKSNEIFVIEVNGEPVEVSADDEEEIMKLKKAASSMQRVFAGRERARERLEHDPELLQKHFHLHDTQDYSDDYCELEADTYVLAGALPLWLSGTAIPITGGGVVTPLRLSA